MENKKVSSKSTKVELLEALAEREKEIEELKKLTDDPKKEQEKAEKEVKDVKLQIRRAAEFLQNSFPGGAEVVLFEANLARSPALRDFLIEKSMDAE